MIGVIVMTILSPLILLNWIGQAAGWIVERCVEAVFGHGGAE